jgi:hypothetical protein
LRLGRCRRHLARGPSLRRVLLSRRSSLPIWPPPTSARRSTTSRGLRLEASPLPGTPGWQPGAARRRGRDGSLLFSDGLCDRSAPTTPAGSWVLQLQALRTVHGLRPPEPGLGSRSSLLSQDDLRRGYRIPHRTDRSLARRPRRLCRDASTVGSPLPPATSYGAAWPLPRPDSHRQVHRRLFRTHHRRSFFFPDRTEPTHRRGCGRDGRC